MKIPAISTLPSGNWLATRQPHNKSHEFRNLLSFDPATSTAISVTKQQGAMYVVGRIQFWSTSWIRTDCNIGPVPVTFRYKVFERWKRTHSIKVLKNKPTEYIIKIYHDDVIWSLTKLHRKQYESEGTEGFDLSVQCRTFHSENRLAKAPTPCKTFV